MFFQESRQIRIAVILATVILATESDKILLVPFPWPSHYTQLERIGEELVKRKHDVVMITPSTETYRSKSSLKNVEYELPKFAKNAFVSIAEKRLETGTGFGLSWLAQYVSMLEKFGTALMEDMKINRLAKEADIVISDTAYLVAPIFAEYHNLPLVFVSPFGHLPGCMADVFGNIENPSLVPTFVATSLFERIGLPQRMNFFQRSFNFLSYLISKILRETITMPILRPLTRKYSSKPLLQLWQQVQLVLLPMDYSVEYPRPDLPFVKMIGPLTTTDNMNDLPKAFDKILKSSGLGTIVVSFGITNKLHFEDASRILEGLMEIGYTVIWKYDTQMIEKIIDKLGLKGSREVDNETVCEKDPETCQFCRNQSKLRRSVECYARMQNKNTSFIKVGTNLYIHDWLPQQQLLEQKKTKLLVSHCGMNSLYEALYHNTQLLCIPLFGEQFDNAGRIVSRNIGKALRLKDVDKRSLKEAVNDLMNKRIYKSNVHKISRRLHRSKETPVEKAAYWIEYVLAERGDVTFLRPAVLSFKEYYMIDIIAAWGSVIYILFWLMFRMYSLERFMRSKIGSKCK